MSVHEFISMSIPGDPKDEVIQLTEKCGKKAGNSSDSCDEHSSILTVSHIDKALDDIYYSRLLTSDLTRNVDAFDSLGYR